MLTRRPGVLEELTCDRHALPTQRTTNTAGDVPLFDFRFLELKKILMPLLQSTRKEQKIWLLLRSSLAQD